jgi:hypothetical protein
MIKESKIVKPDFEKRRKLSEFILQEFKAKEYCNACLGFGIRIKQFDPNSTFYYVPCYCLKNKEV